MKKLFVLSLLVLPLATSAQFGKGNIFLGGGLSVELQNTDLKPPLSSAPTSQTNKSFGIAPSLGFFVSDKIAVGTALSFSTQKIEYNPSNGYTTKIQTNSIGINPYVRFYQPISTSIYFALQGGVSFYRSNSKQTINNGTAETVTEYPMYSLAASFRPVFIFFPSPKWGLEAGVGSLTYGYTRNLPDAGSTSSFGLNAGSFTFGIAYYFIKK